MLRIRWPAIVSRCTPHLYCVERAALCILNKTFRFWIARLFQPLAHLGGLRPRRNSRAEFIK